MKTLSLVVACAVFCFSTVAYGQEPRETGSKYLALTFDDGPDQQLTPLLLDVLKTHKAKATFFVDGQKIESNAQLIKRMADEGHCIGNHTLSHRKLTELAENDVRVEIESTNALVKKIAAVDPVVFRPPYGAINEHVITHTRNNTLSIILWNIYPDDSKFYTSANAIKNHIVAQAKDGDIVFMHDTYQRSVEATEAVILHLAEKGFIFVTVPELIEKHGGLQAGGVYKSGLGVEK